MTCVLLGAAVRVAACFNDLWMDEIWTHELAADVDSPLDVLVGIHSWNNHHLNTLVFHLLGPDAPGALYRLPSVLAGFGGVAMAALLLLRQGRLEAWIAALLTSTSYLLIHYSSEARGYSCAVFFALVGLYALLRHVERPSPRLLVLFWAAVLLGALSHLGFLQFYVGAALWSVWRYHRTRAEEGSAFDRLLLLHAVPVVGLALLYHFDVRHVSGGGGPPYDLTAVVIESASYVLNGPPRGVGALATAGLLIALAGAALAGSRWRARGESLLFALVCFAVPSVTIAAGKPVVLFPRYFLIGSTFLLLLLAPLLADLVRAGGLRRRGAAILLAGFVLGGAFKSAALLRDGRGRYLEALRTIEAATTEGVVTLGSDSDFRNGMVIRFHRRYLERPERLRYIAREERGAAPEWRLLHRFTDSDPPDETIHDDAGNSYHWVRTFPYSALSGWHWLLYRR